MGSGRNHLDPGIEGVINPLGEGDTRHIGQERGDKSFGVRTGTDPEISQITVIY
jgi:hypothetical protein